MPKSILDPHVLAELERRLKSLPPQAVRRWGTMTAGEMLCHVADGLEQALGRRPARDQGNLLLRTVVRLLVVNVLPMPKGAPTSDAMAPGRAGTVPSDFERDRSRALTLLAENASRPAHEPFARHPAFGALSRRERGILTWKHLDHHLRQFGA